MGRHEDIGSHHTFSRGVCPSVAFTGRPGLGKCVLQAASCCPASLHPAHGQKRHVSACLCYDHVNRLFLRITDDLQEMGRLGEIGGQLLPRGCPDVLRQVTRVPRARPGHICHLPSGAVCQVHLPSRDFCPPGPGLCGPPLLSCFSAVSGYHTLGTICLTLPLPTQRPLGAVSSHLETGVLSVRALVELERLICLSYAQP